MTAPITVERSRVVPVGPERAFEGTLTIPLSTIFSRRFGLLPPIASVRGQQGTWGHVGQSRTIIASDGLTMHETLTDVRAPHSFSYRLSEISGPLRRLVESIDGRWEFTPGGTGTGTTITWRWILHPKGVGVAVLPLFALMWRGYARRSLETLSEQLQASGGAEAVP